MYDRFSSMYSRPPPLRPPYSQGLVHGRLRIILITAFGPTAVPGRRVLVDGLPNPNEDKEILSGPLGIIGIRHLNKAILGAYRHAGF